MLEVLLYPWGDYYLDNKIFSNKNFYNISKVEKNPILLLKEQLNEKDFDFKTIDKGNINDAQFVIFFEVPKKNNFYFKICKDKKINSKLILFLWEPEVVNTRNYNLNIHKEFRYVFTWNDDLVDNIKYFKFNYPQPYKIKNIHEKKFEEKRLCTLIAANKSSKIKGQLYSERLKALEYFEYNNIKGFEFYGRGWNKPNNKIQKILPLFIKKFTKYNGETFNKMETLSNYKFCICYENQKNVNGYITEKIFDCFLSGCVPIYWGAENIFKYVPQECFIDRRRFKSDDEVYNFIKNINEKQYYSYIEQINKFLCSERYYQFTDEFFAKSISTLLAKDTYK